MICSKIRSKNPLVFKRQKTWFYWRIFSQPPSCELNRKREFGNSKNERLPRGAKCPFHLRETWLLLIDYRSSIDWSKWLAIGVIGVTIGVNSL